MSRALGCGVLLCLLASCDSASEDLTGEAGVSGPPNILLIMADDLGYTDLGAFGGEIQTPHLDQLARSGLRLTNFHTAPSCAPTRAMLLSGTDHHLVGVGSQSGLQTPLQGQHRHYENRLYSEVETLPERLRDAGYRTVASAKWHLGFDAPFLPGAQGFDRSFVLLQGGGGHFDDTTAIPRFETATWLEDDRPVALPDTFYSTDFMTDKLLEYLEEDRGGAPFFAYLSYTAPHWPLQAHPEDIERYRDRYTAGWDDLRANRMRGARREGVVAANARGVNAEAGTRPWASLDAAEREREAATMAVYAAMVDRLDANVGRVLDYLDETGQRANTVIVFLSDNGAEAHAMEDYFGDWVEANFDSGLEALGSRRSYATLGPSWARATAVPFRASKSKISEGGTRVPVIVWLPGREVGIDPAFMRVMDLAPSLLALAGSTMPDDIMGRSLVDRWRGGAAPYGDEEIVAGETYGRRMARMGRWKALRQEAPYGSGTWALYDLETDPEEQIDVSGRFPEIKARLLDGYARYAAAVGVIDPETPIRY